jgi:hypothetical protein
MRRKLAFAATILVALTAIAANYRIDIGKVWKSLELQPGCTVINRDGNDIAAQLDALDTIVAADLTKIDGITDGTAAANKAVVLGASKEIATITTATITTGNIATVNATDVDAGASGTAGTVDVFPSTASRGKLAITAADSAGHTITTLVNASQAAARTYTIPDAGASASFVMTAGAQTIGGAKTFSSALVTTAGIGAAAGTGVAATAENGDGILHQTTLTFTNVDVVLTDEAGVIAYGGLKFYTLPEGAIVVHGAVANLAVTKSSAGVNVDWDGDFAIGTVTAANDADLTSTEADVLPKTATPQAAAGATTAHGVNAAAAYLDGTTAAKELFVNFLVDDADHDVTSTPCNLILNGTIKITWINAGDH